MTVFENNFLFFLPIENPIIPSVEKAYESKINAERNIRLIKIVLAAANTILINLIFLSAFILDSYAFSTEGIIGFSIGKKNKKLFSNTVKNSFILSSFTGALISLIYFFVNNAFINFMTDIESVKNISYQFSIWLILLPFISSFCYQFDGIFIGASQTKELRNAMFISVTLYLLSSYFLVQNFENLGLWISFTMFLFLRALTLGFYFKRIYLKF